jgi:hypothetical protein
MPCRGDIRQLIMYRDCRDVVSSSLVRARTFWKGPLADQYNTAEKIIRSWLRAIEIMKDNMGKIHAIRYEDLIHESAKTLKSAAEFLNIDSNGFDKKMIHPQSIGKHKNLISEQDLDMIRRVAGPAMKELGYL